MPFASAGMLDNDPRRTIVRLAVAVMTADGRVTPNEIACVERLEELGLGPLRALVGAELERAARVPLEVAETCGVLAAASPPTRAAIFAALASVAAADGLDDTEARLLQEVARALALSDEVAMDVLREATFGSAGDGGPRMHGASAPTRAEPQSASAPARTEPLRPAAAPVAGPRAAADPDLYADACAHLGVPPAASAAAMDAAYRRLVERYDPVRVLELGPEFAVLAVRRLTAATAAYELARSRVQGA
jgi:DnaJ-domain-containing protein 1